MKLIKCNVENFGTLCDFSADFTDGLCVIKEDNGFGKTTVAAFIKAMFYGLPVTKKADLNENERAKFDPWQGGNYGGSLDFECEKGTYRIERFFGSKAKDDTFRLFDLKSGAESLDFTENIGNELFGLDAESFERSIFLPQQRLGTSLNASINAKLTGLVENSDDIGNFDTAMQELDKQQKTKGVKGRLDALNKEITALERQIVDGKTATAGLDALKERLSAYRDEEARLTSELEVLRKNISIASNMAAVQKDNERRTELLEQVKRAEQVKNTVSAKYVKMPTEKEASMLSTLVEQYNSVTSGLEMLRQDGLDGTRLEELQALFQNGLPTDEEISDCRENLRQYNTARATAEALSARISAVPEPTGKPKGAAQKIILAVALLLALGGIGALFVNTAVGIALLAVGIIAAGVAGFLVLKGMISAAPTATNDEDLKLQYKTLTAKAEEYYSKVTEFTSKYGQGEPSAVVEKISAEVSEYKVLKSSYDRKNEKLAAEKQCQKAIFDGISELFVKLMGEVPQSFGGHSAEMKEDIRLFKTAELTLAECSEKLKVLPEREMPEGASNLDCEALIARETEVGERIDAIGNEARGIKARIDAAERAADALMEHLAVLDEKAEQKCELEAKLQIVQLTEKLLKEARDSLSGRYMTVLKDGFKRYTSDVYGDDVGEFILDNSLTLNMQRKGGARGRDYFSEGYRDMLDICMRLALSDALYEDEKPMLILDDPFVNLDDDRVKNALSMLEKLAENRQIIYLTCHTSRMPE